MIQQNIERTAEKTTINPPTDFQWSTAKFWMTVITIILRVFFLSSSIILSIVVLIASYYFGYLQGFSEGQKTTEQYIIKLVEEKGGESSFVVTSDDQSEEKKLNQLDLTYGKKVSWGGPELWKAVNEKRVEYGVNPLDQRDELCTIASIRLNELLELGKLDGHEGFSNMTERRPDLQWIFDKYSTVAEFLAVGGESPYETVSLWDDTLGHKKLLSGGEYVWGCIYSQDTFAVAIAAY